MNISYIRKLPAAKKVQEMYPLRAEDKEQKARNDKEIQKIFIGEDPRILLIIGPCSADRDDAVMDYVSRLQKIQEKVKEKIKIVPRVYTNKPRTTGQGYKGMLHQPDPNKRPDLLKGVLAIRRLHMRVLQECGMATADEMLYPENYRFLSDVLGYVAVGARSVENQQHRLVSSGISVPVGMKNPTSGDLSVMMNSVKAAQAAHSFIFTDREVRSTGNPLAHTILRGYVDRYGQSIPNYHYEDLKKVAELYTQDEYENPAIVVDCNHSNSGKQYEEQIRIAKEILHSARYAEEIRVLIKGLMIESYIEDGNQSPDGGIYGKSITDPCLGWEKTERLILDLADAL